MLRSSEGSCSTCLLVLLTLTLAALASYVIYKEVIVDDAKTLRFVETEEQVLHVYGYLFRTPLEQDDYERQFFQNPNNTVEVRWSEQRGNYGQLCPRIGKMLQKRQAAADLQDDGIDGRVEHACCTSYRRFETPNVAVSDHTYKNVRLVQFDNKRQYFLKDVCWQGSSCPVRCRCRMQVGLHRALVHNPEYGHNQSKKDDDYDQLRFIVQTIRFGGACKCINYHVSENPILG